MLRTSYAVAVMVAAPRRAPDDHWDGVLVLLRAVRPQLASRSIPPTPEQQGHIAPQAPDAPLCAVCVQTPACTAWRRATHRARLRSAPCRRGAPTNMIIDTIGYNQLSGLTNQQSLRSHTLQVLPHFRPRLRPTTPLLHPDSPPLPSFQPSLKL